MRKIEQRDLHTDLGQVLESMTDIRFIATLRLDLARQMEEGAQDALDHLTEERGKAQAKLNEAKIKRRYWESQEAKLESLEAAEDRTAVDEDGIKTPPQEDLYGHLDTEEAEEEASLPSRSAQFALVAHPDISLERMHDLFLSVGQNAIWEAGSGGRVEIEPVKDWVYNVPRNMHAFTAWFDLPTHTRPPVKEEDFLNDWHQRFLDALEDMPRVHSEYESGRDINVVSSGGGRSNVWDITARVTLPYGVSPQEFREDLTEAGNKLLVEREGERRGKVDR